MPPRRHDASLRPTLTPLALAIASFVGAASADEAPEFGPAQLLHEPAAVAPDPFGATVGLSPFQPADVSSGMRRLLLQFEALAADEAWDEAIDLVERVAQDDGELAEARDAGVPSRSADAQEHTRYVPDLQRRHQLLAALPPEGLLTYRARVDRAAEQRYAEAARRLDEAALRLAADEFIASTAAGDALLGAAELALERGDYVAARRALNRLHPLAWDPDGRPAAATLVALDPRVEAERLGVAWRGAPRPEGLETIPTDDELLAPALARLALVSLREGDLRRAAAEVRLLRGLAPDAVGRLAGRQQPLADALDQLVETARIGTRTGTVAPPALAWAWERPVELTPSPVALARQAAPLQQVMIFNGGIRQIPALQALQDRAAGDDLPPWCRPVTDGVAAFYVERGELVRLDLASGATLPAPIIDDGEAPAKPKAVRPQPGDMAGVRVMAGGVIRFTPGNRAGQTAKARVDENLAAEAGVLYARVIQGQRAIRLPNGGVMAITDEELVGVEAGRPGATTVRYQVPTSDDQAATGGYQFAGPPMVRGPRLYVALVRKGVQSEIALACYATATGRLHWATLLGSGEAPALQGESAPLKPLVTGDTVYLATNAGAIAAVDSRTGRRSWIATYPRDAGANRQGLDATPRPCVFAGGCVVTAPADSTSVFAWDAGTGRLVWEAPCGDGAEITGVVQGPDGAVVVVAGDQAAGYDALTGERRFLWPESPRAGLRGVGSATLWGDEFFWPTRDAVYALDATTGAMTRPPIDLATVGSAGANLVPTDYGLLVCGPKRMRLLATLEAATEPPAAVSRLTEAGPTHLASTAPKAKAVDARR